MSQNINSSWHCYQMMQYRTKFLIATSYLAWFKKRYLLPLRGCLCRKMFRNSIRIFTTLLKSSRPTTVPERTTFILRRRTEYVRNNVLDDKPKLLRKHYFYLLEEDTNERKPEEIDLILLKNVKAIGNAGDIVKVDKIRAYEYYIVSGAAIPATPENVKKYAHVKKSDTSVETKILLHLLERTHVPVFMNENNEWTLSPWHLKLALRKIGVVCNEKCLRLPEKPIIGPNLDFQKKDFVTYITVNEKYTIPLRCRLFHVTFSQINFMVSFNPKFYLEPIDAIFPEEKEILEKIPLPVEKNEHEFIIED